MNSSNRTNSKGRAKLMKERAGNRAFLYTAHAAAAGYRAEVITSDDTYEFVLMLFYCMVMESVTLLDFVVGYSVPNKAKLTRTRLFLLFKDVLLRANYKLLAAI